MSAYLEQVNHVLRQLPEYLQEIIPAKKPVGAPPVHPLPPHLADMSWIVRVAGLSGAAAISLGAYGAHVIRDGADIEQRRIKAFETGSRYHLIHSLAFLASTKAKYPAVTAALFAGGMLLFCGPCYHYGITGNEKYRPVTPKGGILLILGWLSFIL